MLSPAANGAPWLSDPLYGGMSAEAAHKSWEAGQTRDQQITYQPAKATHPMIRCARDLRAKEFPPIRFVVPGFIVEGCTLLAGRPKLGKSWLMLHVALSVSSGTAAMGAAAFEPGDVLYLALEDNERRLQSRITKLSGFATEWSPRLHYATDWPRADAGGLDAIRTWIKSVERPRLVVVDVLAMFRSPRVNRDSPYESDYQAIQGLQAIASEFAIAIVVVHHLRKSGAEVDPFEKVSGTLGLSGAADTVLILDRDSNGTTIYGRGRDIEEIETAVEFDRETCLWRVMGKAADVRRSDERTTILQVIERAKEPLSPREVADLIDGASYEATRKTMRRMAEAGELKKVGRGSYTCPNGPNVPNDSTEMHIGTLGHLGHGGEGQP